MHKSLGWVIGYHVPGLFLSNNETQRPKLTLPVYWPNPPLVHQSILLSARPPTGLPAWPLAACCLTAHRPAFLHARLTADLTAGLGPVAGWGVAGTGGVAVGANGGLVAKRGWTGVGL